MCSTFKWVLAAAVLARIDRAQLSLDDRVEYGPPDLLEHSPATRKHVAEGSMTIEALAAASVSVSDNAAANLLLAKIGGPAGFTRFVRGLGDSVTRLDRDEPTLNENSPDDPRDTTSPRAMADLMQRILCSDVLSATSRTTLLAWLRECETGNDRLRAGLPRGWSVGHKTGTGQRGAVNDVAIAWPPDRAPVLVVSYLSDGQRDVSTLAAAHADIAKFVARELRAASADVRDEPRG
jgi:beta-lactamase class A